MTDAERKLAVNRMYKLIGVWTNKDLKNVESKDYQAFAKFLGLQEGKEYIVDIHNKDVRELLATLDGPNTKTLFKIIELRNKEKVNG